MLSNVIIAIALWCGQPQTQVVKVEDMVDRSWAYGYAKNDMVLKSECQRKLLACVGVNPKNRSLYKCMMDNYWVNPK